ncbi:hypothetical protein IG631_24150 [Alternaria alternata]|nr:hypothetical protein IG631_24150 [Alternaria alternata]
MQLPKAVFTKPDQVSSEAVLGSVPQTDIQGVGWAVSATVRHSPPLPECSMASAPSPLKESVLGDIKCPLVVNTLCYKVQTSRKLGVTHIELTVQCRSAQTSPAVSLVCMQKAFFALAWPSFLPASSFCG